MFVPLRVAAILVLNGAPLAQAEPPVPYPHPLVTELLYAVPPGDKGDASGDGVRDAVGDEFVELVNPHQRSIQLKGYTITDGTPDDALVTSKPDPAKSKSAAPKQASRPADKDKPAGEGEDSEAAHKQVRFTFPALELKPGEVAVVFNGHKQKIKGPVGDAKAAPTAKNENFFSAYVFSMKNDSQYVAFSNTADCMIVWDPQGKPVEAVHWRHNVRAAKEPAKEAPKPGARDKAPADKNTPKVATPGPASDRAVPPPGTILVETAPDARGSVARVGLTKKLLAHSELPDGKGELFGPGKFDATATGDGDEAASTTQPK